MADDKTIVENFDPASYDSAATYANQVRNAVRQGDMNSVEEHMESLNNELNKIREYKKSKDVLNSRLYFTIL